MKVYIYRKFLNLPRMEAFEAQVSKEHRLGQHLTYLRDFIEHFKSIETENPDEADFYFVPIFLLGFQFRNLDPIFLIEHCEYLERGRHLLLATGDFGQRKRSPWESEAADRAYKDTYPWLDERFHLIALESTTESAETDVGFLPYISDLSPDLQRNASREFLISFVGATSYYPRLPRDHIRGGRMLELARRFPGRCLIGTDAEINAHTGLQASARDYIAASVFTLCPAGYGRWSFRLMESLLLGSIPVVLSNGYVLPFSESIDWSRYVYRFDESELERVIPALEAEPVSRVHEKLKNIRQDRALFERSSVLRMTIDSMKSTTRRASPTDRHFQKAIQRMRSPRDMGIICIDVTNKCDLHCSNCTRLLANQEHLWDMTPENFRLALRSLSDYPGTIAMIGGNPCMHPQFEELCRIFVQEIPNKAQRGLWSNHIFKHHDLVKETFGGFNLNPHGVERGIQSLKRLHDEVKLGNYYEGQSKHAPLLTAVRDLYPEEQMWKRISECDINREWSASIVEVRGELRAYFCEVAASFDLARDGSHGAPVEPGWWKKSILDYAAQVKKFCPGCGVPARLSGHFDCEEIDTFSESNRDLAEKSTQKKKRKVIFVKSVEDAGVLAHKVTHYTQSHLRPYHASAVP